MFTAERVKWTHTYKETHDRWVIVSRAAFGELWYISPQQESIPSYVPSRVCCLKVIPEYFQPQSCRLSSPNTVSRKKYESVIQYRPQKSESAGNANRMEDQILLSSSYSFPRIAGSILDSFLISSRDILALHSEAQCSHSEAFFVSVSYTDTASTLNSQSLLPHWWPIIPKLLLNDLGRVPSPLVAVIANDPKPLWTPPWEVKRCTGQERGRPELEKPQRGISEWDMWQRRW